MQTSQSTGFAWSRTSLRFVIRHHFFLVYSIFIIPPSWKSLNAFLPIGRRTRLERILGEAIERGGRHPIRYCFPSVSSALSAWRRVCASPCWENRRLCNGQRKQIIRTHLRSETSSDYIVLEHRNTIDANFLLRIISICNLGLMLKVVFTWF